MLRTAFALTLTVAALLPALSEPLPQGQYVTIRDGHLWHNGSRLRLWGVNFCHSVKRQGKDLELCFDRLAFGGFNGVRLNYSSFMIQGHEPLQHSCDVAETVMGSGSDIDRLDHSIFLARQRGMFFWFSFNQYRSFLPADYDLLSDDGTRAEWEAMIQEASIPYLVYVDDRAEAVFLRYAANVLNHVNPYTGRRYADEEAIGLYEIFNEDGFVESTLTQKKEGIVGRKLQERWNAWLQARYPTDAELRQAWGAVKEGESPAEGTVAFAPLADEAAGYPEARGQDLMRFVYDLYTGFTHRFIEYVRSLGAPGVGIGVVPITPTGNFANSLAGYYSGSCGDFTSVGNYGFALRPWEVAKEAPHYPWVVRVNGFPMMETPIDLVRVAGKPYLIYETNDYRPNPFTVEFPLRAAINALWKDGDGVFWFTWDDSGYLHTLATDEDYAKTRMPMPDTTYPNAGLVLANDEVALAAIASAGDVFRHGGLKPAAAPATATIGGDILLNLSDHQMQRVYDRLHRAAWRTGLEISYDSEVSTALPAASPGDHPSSLRMGEEISLDWTDGRGTVRIDAPAVKAQVGFSGAEVLFDDLRVTGINREYTYIAAVGRDGRPLDQSSDVMLTLVSRSTNTDCVLDPERMEAQWSTGLGQAVVNGGRAPVLVDRVAATLAAPWLRGRWYQKVDFARNCLQQGRAGEELEITADEPVYCIRLTPEPPPAPVRRVLIIGNSLTRHGASEALGWPYDCGMAATGEDKDYAHLLYRRICEAQPQLVPELRLGRITDEAHMKGFEQALPSDADVVILQLGDNYRGAVNEEELRGPYERMVAAARNGGRTRVFCVGSWGSEALDTQIQAAAEAQGVPFVMIRDLGADAQNRAGSEGHFTHSGVNWHPGDRGMAAIAQRLWEHMRVLWKVP